jgi:Acyl-CoA oxidase
MSDQFKTKDSFRSIELLIGAWDSCASHCVRVAASKVMEGSTLYDGNFKESWDKYAGTFLYTAGKVHSINFTMKAMHQGITLFKNEYNQVAYRRLCALFGINQLLRNSNLFFEAGILTSDKIQMAESLLEDLLAEIRPDAASWMECYGFPESFVSSAIGKRDKEPYEEMMRMIREHAQLNLVDAESLVKEHIFPLRRQINSKL